jgi:hypothetical protein
MSDFSRIERLIREANVQRSAAIGSAIGGFLGDTYLIAAEASRKAIAALRGSKAPVARRDKAAPAR